eukprot:198325-Prymnesium_polylepis.2
MGKKGRPADQYVTKAVNLVRCPPRGAHAVARGRVWSLAPAHAAPRAPPLSQMVNAGLTAAEAYDAVPELHAHGKKVLQNLRKRAKAQRGLDEPAGSAGAKPAAKPPKPKAKPRHALLPKGKRLRSDQVDAIEVHKAERRLRRSAAHKQATRELEELKAGGGRTPNGKLVEIADRANEEHNLSASQRLTPRGISQAVQLGKAGDSPQPPGPPPLAPKSLAKSLGIRAQLMQMAGAEQGSRKLLASAMASLMGTDLEGLLDNKSKRKRMVRVIKAACPELRTKQRKSSDDRRAEWLCRSRLLRWFLGYVRALKEAGFIEPKPDGPLYIPPWKLRRLINSDEKHHKLSNEGA